MGSSSSDSESSVSTGSGIESNLKTLIFELWKLLTVYPFFCLKMNVLGGRSLDYLENGLLRVPSY